jgi:protein-S-isoprenylcysteine O-methyltransferase Ste14
MNLFIRRSVMIGAWFKKYEKLINVLLCVDFIGFGVFQFYKAVVLTGRWSFVEASFIIQSVLLAIIILIRKPFQDFNGKWFEQMIALIAFFSGGLLFRDQPVTGGIAALRVSQILMICANVLGVVTVLNLGRSFGILIAFRELKSNGLYRMIRHPMYFTDILLRFGFVVSHANLLSIVVLLVSSSCYVYRALLEERFLSRQPEYREYMQTVKYRFIPFVF